MVGPVESPEYIAVIGDLVASRAHPSRQKVQKEIVAMARDLSSALGAKHLAAPITLTAGDEIQCLFRRPERLVETIQELTDRMFGAAAFPYIVFGVGRGTLTTGPVPREPGQAENPALLDGTAFHRARGALEAAQRERTWARFDGFGESTNTLLGALFSLMGAVRSRWGIDTELGRYSYLARSHPTQKGLAEEEGVSPSVVSESLKAAHHKALLAGEEAARNLLVAPDAEPR